MKKFLLLSASVLLIVGLMIFAVSPVIAANATMTIKPGATLTVPTRFWCMDFGKNFPPVVISHPAERAPDGVIAVLEVAMTMGTVITNPYQTQLAIWRVTTGKFNDYGNKGTTLAEQLYNASLNFTVPAVPTDQLTLADLIASGILTITVTNFSSQKDLINPGLVGPDFFGTGSLVITNTTQQTVTFLLLQGSVFAPPAGVDAQSVVSQFDVPKKPNIPPTGADLQSESMTVALLGGIGGIICISLAATVFRRARRRQLNAT